MYKQLKDSQTELNDLRVKGFQRGLNIGWDWDLLPLTIKLGSTTFMGAAPVSGKTELIKEIQINLSCLHGLNHVIYTPETGNTAEIYAELCHAYIGKAYLKGFNEMSESERISAEMFIDQHFIIVDPLDEDLTIHGFYKLVDQIERDTGKTIHTTLIDPWNELSEEYLPQDLGREDKYLSRILKDVGKNARAKNRHNFIITHVRDQPQITVGEIRYYPPAHAREFAGGQVWFRKGLLMLIPWRPPLGLSDDNHIPYKENELHLKIAKSKPKGVSQNGTYKLFFDVTQCRYYMQRPGDPKKIYANRGQTETKKELTPNKEFDKEPNRYEKPDDLPF